MDRARLTLLGLAILAQTGAPTLALAQSFSTYLPWGHYPSMETRQKDPYAEFDEDATLAGEIRDFSKDLSAGVRYVAQRRNFSCLGAPCRYQLIPLLYSKPNSGFFGGIRANMTNISRQDPFTWVGDLQLVRSDTRQWLSFASIDFPRIEWLPFEPRLKIRGTYAKSTEFRYYGQGEVAQDAYKVPDSDARYSLISHGVNSTLLLPLSRSDPRTWGLYVHFSTTRNTIDRFQEGSTFLFDTRPTGIKGGFSSVLGGGFFWTNVDRELLARKGQSLELGVLGGGNPLGNYQFRRATLVDRRYISWKRLTLAHRLTGDAIFGNPPFWELAGVGGIDPLTSVAGSGLLPGYPPGRFHALYKVIESIELRVHHRVFRALNQYIEPITIPFAASGAYFGDEQFAWSGSVGAQLLWNKSFLTRVYLNRSAEDWTMNLRFGQEF
jgi:hypothetical protein